MSNGMGFRVLGEPVLSQGLQDSRRLGYTQGGVPTKNPDQVTGLTGWWDASDIATLFTDAGTTPVSIDGDKVYRMADKSGGAGNRYFQQATEANRPLYKVFRQSSRSGLLFDGVNDVLPNGLAMSNFFTAGIAYIFIVFKPLGVLLSSDEVIGDSAGYLFLSSHNGGDVALTNWDGSYDFSADVALTANQAILITAWHTDGNLYIQANNGAVSGAVASGNTTNLNSVLSISGVTVEPNMDFYEAAVFNQAVTDADRDLLNRGFMAKWGLNPNSPAGPNALEYDGEVLYYLPTNEVIVYG